MARELEEKLNGYKADLEITAAEIEAFGRRQIELDTTIQELRNRLKISDVDRADVSIIDSPSKFTMDTDASFGMETALY